VSLAEKAVHKKLPRPFHEEDLLGPPDRVFGKRAGLAHLLVQLWVIGLPKASRLA
jgi:hypothetical protein